MSTERLMCNSCGAPLDVPSAANFVTCNHCGTQLSINRSHDVSYTEQLSRLEASTDELTNQLRELNSHQKLEALDREWQQKQASFLISGKRGHRIQPSGGLAIGGGLAAAAFGVLWTIMAIAITSGAPDFGPFAVAKIVFPLFGVVFVGAAIFGSLKVHHMASGLRHSEDEYRKERDRLLKEAEKEDH